MLSKKEEQRIKDEYDRKGQIYTNVSNHIYQMCLQYKRRKPGAVRAIFSREPILKTFLSIKKKIELKRQKGKPGYSFHDLTDVIGLTVLCAYESDVTEFNKWLRNSFAIDHKATEEPLKEYSSGHRAHHYVVKVDKETVKRFPDFRDIRCEIQVKTLLQEAFDAKAHDLTYKQGPWEVDKRLPDQFAVLSRSLRAVDEQSEFLKNLVQENERNYELHRRACVRAFLDTPGTAKKLNSLDIKLDSSTSITSVADKLEDDAAKGISIELCRVAAICALELRDDFLEGEALRICDQYIESIDRDNGIMMRACIRWSLAYYELALQDLKDLLKQAKKNQDHKLAKNCMSNMVYFVADGFNLKKMDGNLWVNEARRLVKLLKTSRDLGDIDTIGFFHIVFGKTPLEIESGRKMIERVKNKRGEDKHTSFFRYHEYSALRRLMTMLSDRKNPRKEVGAIS